MTGENDIKLRYFESLKKDILSGIDYDEATPVLDVLFDEEFYWTVSMDENRAVDGIDLRKEYLRSVGVDPNEAYWGPCSVLEMMWALAKRINDDIMYDPDGEWNSSAWFFDMFTNLGLNECVGANFSISKIRYILQNFMDREYSPDGKGGLFPLKNAKHDQRNIEIWYQMQVYLMENFDF